MTEIKAEVDFVQMAEDIAVVKKVLLGNGVKGLCQRVDDLEDNAKVTGIIGAICGFVGAGITYIIQNFRG